MKRDPGTYALVLQNDADASVQIGRLGVINIVPGYYIYVGSAFGPGGVQARVLRHYRKARSRHWHIDYLREFVTPVGAWYGHDSHNLEHQWAQAFSEMIDMAPVKGFGCSDCKCYSHLFTTPIKPDIEQFSDIVGGGVACNWIAGNIQHRCRTLKRVF
jgi:Uri superfamily endonuclease